VLLVASASNVPTSSTSPSRSSLASTIAITRATWGVLDALSVVVSHREEGLFWLQDKTHQHAAHAHGPGHGHARVRYQLKHCRNDHRWPVLSRQGATWWM
jgi:hypothetical protein